MLAMRRFDVTTEELQALLEGVPEPLRRGSA